HLRTSRRILQPRNPRLESAVLYPRRHGSIESGSSGSVCIHVGRDAYTGGLGGLDLSYYTIELVPVVAAGHLQVIDLGGRSTRLRDVHGLLNSRLDAIPLATHVRGIDATAACRLLRERDQLRSLGVSRRCIDQRGRQAESTFFHGLADQ